MNGSSCSWIGVWHRAAGHRRCIRSSAALVQRLAASVTMVVACALSSSAMAGEATVERGDLVLSFERKARVEPALRRPVRYEPEVFGGRLELAARARGPGAVKAGEVVIELTAREFAEQLEDARVLATEAERRLEVQRHERRIGLEQARLAVDRAEFAADAAARSLEIFKTHESAKSIEMREIGLLWQQDALKDERQELEQLEKMYKGTSLAEETKDIVLERSRRALARTERQSKYWERDLRNYVEVEHPREAKRIEDAARFSAFDLEVARVNARLSTVRVELDLAAAERGVRDAQRRAERLERDHGKLQVVAPIDGYWMPQVREAGELVQAWQTLGDIAEIQPLRLRGTLDPLALRVLQPNSDGGWVGSTATLRLTARPELDAIARFTEVVTVGAPDGDSTSFPFLAAIEGDTAGVLVGFEGVISGRRTLEGVLLIPDKAISGAPARPVVKRKKGDVEDEVAIRVGLSAGGKTVVLEGLSEGDRVVTPDG